MILRLRHDIQFNWEMFVQLVAVLLHQIYFCSCTIDYCNCKARGWRYVSLQPGLCRHKNSGRKWWYLYSQCWNPSKSHICRLIVSRHISPPLNQYPLFYGSCSSQKHKAILMRLCIAMRLNHPNLLCTGLLCSNSSWKRLLPGSQVLMPAFQPWPKLGICWLCPTLNDTIEWTALESIVCPELAIEFGWLDDLPNVTSPLSPWQESVAEVP